MVMTCRDCGAALPNPECGHKKNGASPVCTPQITSYYGDVGEFHAKFNLTTDADRVPGLLAPEVFDYRVAFLLEELQEFVCAQSQRDLAKAADALVDLVYVALGTAHFMGLPFDELWAEVQRANLAKERVGEDATSPSGVKSARGHRLDVVKPPGWQPEIERVLHERLLAWRQSR